MIIDSIQYTTLISWDHVFDIYECILTTCLLQQLQSFTN